MVATIGKKNAPRRISKRTGDSISQEDNVENKDLLEIAEEESIPRKRTRLSRGSQSDKDMPQLVMETPAQSVIVSKPPVIMPKVSRKAEEPKKHKAWTLSTSSAGLEKNKVEVTKRAPVSKADDEILNVVESDKVDLRVDDSKVDLPKLAISRVAAPRVVLPRVALPKMGPKVVAESVVGSAVPTSVSDEQVNEVTEEPINIDEEEKVEVAAASNAQKITNKQEIQQNEAATIDVTADLEGVEGLEQNEEYVEVDSHIVMSPGGTTEYIQVDNEEMIVEEEYYEEEAGNHLIQRVPTGASVTLRGVNKPPPRGIQPIESNAEEFNIFDQKQVCCGVCGEIVPFENLMAHHLPEQHPEIMTNYESVDFEEVPYSEWLKEKLNTSKSKMNNHHVHPSSYSPGGSRRGDGNFMSGSRHTNERVLRKVSQVRVNPNEMTIAQLEVALKKKMVEKMGRRVPVSLVDKQHAKCGVCQAIVSLNKKFEIVHLVRHFNAWHPSSHRCSGTWPGMKCAPQQPVQNGGAKPLSNVDFAIVDANINATENLQCIWCGMVMDTSVLAMHFYEVHPNDVEVPKCQLCLQELVVNARLTEKFKQDFDILLPDEYHFFCGKFQTKYSTEKAMERGISAKLKRLETGKDQPEEKEEDEEAAVDGASGKIAPVSECFSNSRMALGRRSKPKRLFVQPSLRQAAPENSKFIEVLSECHWKCKLCDGNIMAAVISAGAIKHFRQLHEAEIDELQVELCKARLKKVSDGCMEFINPSMIECSVCQMTYPLHKPYNMCRAIRHLKAKHPEYMPEYCNDNATEVKGVANETGCEEEIEEVVPESHNNSLHASSTHDPDMKMGEFVTDPEILADLRIKFGVEFDKVKKFINPDGEAMYILMTDDQELDENTINNLTNHPNSEIKDEDELANYKEMEEVELAEALEEVEELEEVEGLEEVEEVEGLEEVEEVEGLEGVEEVEGLDEVEDVAELEEVEEVEVEKEYSPEIDLLED
uniref:C2H2-type domain-containing protein n=1 Tax=Rhabditophanes sp. KR3021 TaxID=114890 RepID=A0AC35U4R4_9BILA